MCHGKYNVQFLHEFSHLPNRLPHSRLMSQAMRRQRVRSCSSASPPSSDQSDLHTSTHVAPGCYLYLPLPWGTCRCQYWPPHTVVVPDWTHHGTCNGDRRPAPRSSSPQTLLRPQFAAEEVVMFGCLWCRYIFSKINDCMRAWICWASQILDARVFCCV
jgi:hypothetical protein